MNQAALSAMCCIGTLRAASSPHVDPLALADPETLAERSFKSHRLFREPGGERGWLLAHGENLPCVHLYG